MASELTGRRCLVFLSGSGYRYCGFVQSDDGEFIELNDERSGKLQIIPRRALERIEVLS